MGNWSVDTESEPGLLRLTLVGKLTTEQVTDLVFAHNRAVDSYGRADYKVWVDMSQVSPLSPDCALILERAKRYSAARPNFRGSAVLVNSAVVGLQHRRTSQEGGVMDTEMISDDEPALRQHLGTVYRRLRP